METEETIRVSVPSVRISSSFPDLVAPQNTVHSPFTRQSTDSSGQGALHYISNHAKTKIAVIIMLVAGMITGVSQIIAALLQKGSCG